MVKPFQIGQEETSRDRKLKSKQQEHKWSKKVGGSTQPASGALWSAKGDVKERRRTLSRYLKNFLWENKYTSHQSYALSLETWLEIRDKAIRKEGGFLPGMQITFTHDKYGRLLNLPVRLVVIDEETFLDLKEAVEMEDVR